MFSSNSVIRRYTAPTCTLEISAQNSPLSRWVEKNVIKDLSFQLQFDHSGVSADSQILIQGDHQQLEVLYDTVTSYVQKIIQESTADLSDLLQPESILSTPTLSSLHDQTPAAEVYLEPSHNLTHKLFLGDLANQTSGSVIELSLLQLFDLATVIDEYSSSNMVVLPTVNAETSTTTLPQWLPIAAVLVVAASLTPFTWQYAQKIPQNQQKIAKNNFPNPEKPEIEQPAISFSNALPIPPVNLNAPKTPLTSPTVNYSTPPTPLSLANGTIPVAPKISPQPVLTIPPNSFSGSGTPQVLRNKIPNYTDKSGKIVINSTKSQDLPSIKSPVPSSVYTLPSAIASINNESFSNIPPAISTSEITELKQ
ncbi:MAG: DUF4335 domain-containing protein, partial [Dolichospermum sp.]